jgi:hypothetical protein
VSPKVPSATAENQYCDDDDQKIGGVHIVLFGSFATGSDTCHLAQPRTRVRAHPPRVVRLARRQCWSLVGGTCLG